MIKIDAETRKVQFWERQGYAVSEPVFIARPQATEEDDGYILFSALDRFNSKRVMLVLLDASTFKEVATVEFATKGTVSSDYHGLFAAKGDLVHHYWKSSARFSPIWTLQLTPGHELRLNFHSFYIRLRVCVLTNYIRCCILSLEKNINYENNKYRNEFVIIGL